MFVQVVRRQLASAWKITKTAATTKQFYNHGPAIETRSVCFQSSVVVRRSYSQKNERMLVDFEYVKQATSDASKALIIDVREPDEIQQHGKIPNSINIPLGNVTNVLGQLSDQEFAKIYQRSKPKKDTEIIFYCMVGKRSATAQDYALKLGFQNSKNYLGSFTDWAEKTKP